MTNMKTVTNIAIPGAVLSVLSLLITFTVEEDFVVEGVMEGVWWPFSLVSWPVGWPLVVCSILSLFDSVDLVGAHFFSWHSYIFCISPSTSSSVSQTWGASKLSSAKTPEIMTIRIVVFMSIIVSFWKSNHK